MISFNQDEWLKIYFEINAELRKKPKNEFEKDVFKRINNAVFGKTMENIRKHRDNKLFTTERRKNYLMLAPNYYSTKFFTKSVLALEISLFVWVYRYQI